MRAAVFILPLVLLASVLRADEPVAPAGEPKPKAVTAPAEPDTTTQDGPTTKPSARLSETLTSILPKYSPPPPEPKASEKPAPDPDVLVLEKKIVTQKKRPRLDDEIMMTNKAFNDLLAKKNSSTLDRALNGLGALGNQSAADRAREEYEYNQRQTLIKDVEAIAKVIELSDPDQAKTLREAAAKP